MTQEGPQYALELVPDVIRVRFERSGTYLWTAASAGSTHIRAMPQLALRGDGLA